MSTSCHGRHCPDGRASAGRGCLLSTPRATSWCPSVCLFCVLSTAGCGCDYCLGTTSAGGWIEQLVDPLAGLGLVLPRPPAGRPAGPILHTAASQCPSVSHRRATIHDQRYTLSPGLHPSTEAHPALSDLLSASVACAVGLLECCCVHDAACKRLMSIIHCVDTDQLFLLLPAPHCKRFLSRRSFSFLVSST